MMKKLTAALLLSILFASPAMAGRYKLPAYLTNAYFCGKLEKRDGLLVPDRVYNVVKANVDELRGALAMNIVADKGSHTIEVDLLDKNAKQFKTVNLEPIEADTDDYAYLAVALFKGPFPEGGVFFKIYDRLGDGSRVELGTMRLLTLK